MHEVMNKVGTEALNDEIHSIRYGEITSAERVAALSDEIHSIHFANVRFWGRKGAHSHKAGVEYYRRQDRLEEIRCELSVLAH